MTRLLLFSQNSTEYLIMASLSKMFAATATYPYQVVRSRLQVRSDQKLFDILKKWGSSISHVKLFKPEGVARAKGHGIHCTTLQNW